MRAPWWLLVLPLAGCALATLATKGSSRPDVDQQIVAGVRHSVQIHRDARGVPHIRAVDSVDAAYALGWVTAEDRLFQADLTRRLAWGEVAQLFGKGAANFDLFARAFDFRHRAEENLREHATPDERACLVAYAHGINDGVASLGTLPVEYRLLHVDWKPWKPVDGVAAVYTMSWALADNLSYEVAALDLHDLDAQTLDALLRLYPGDPPIDGYWDALRTAKIGPYTKGFDAYTSVLGGRAAKAEASNDWVIGPSRSADGMPIVANDPHLVQTVPSLWYAVEYQAGDQHAAGVLLPGTASVVLGHNDHIAWGATNVMADVVDLAVMKRKGKDGYILAGEPKKLEKLEMDVPVAGGETVHGTVYRTAVGPVITHLTDDATHLVALRWHATEIEDQTLQGYYRLGQATSVANALHAMDRPMSVAQNLVLADTGGNYGWQVTGSLVRRKGYTGRVPYPASNPQYGWQGWLDRAPGELNPARGYVYTANSRPDDPLASAISTSYVTPGRHDRIGELLGKRKDWTPDLVRTMQQDVLDTGARHLLPQLLPKVEPTTDAARRCHEILSDWDRHATVHSIGETAFAYFQVELLRQALVDDIGEHDFAVFLGLQSGGRNLLQSDYRRFLQDPQKSVDAALDAACKRMDAERGTDAAGQRWGAVHPVILQHPFAARSGKLQGWNMPVTPWPGTGATLAAGGYAWASKDWRVTYMQSMRFVAPLSDLAHATLIFPGGESGQPGAPTYRSYWDDFVQNDAVPLWFTDADVAAHTVHTETLKPVASGGAAKLGAP